MKLGCGGGGGGGYVQAALAWDSVQAEGALGREEGESWQAGRNGARKERGGKAKRDRSRGDHTGRQGAKAGRGRITRGVCMLKLMD